MDQRSTQPDAGQASASRGMVVIAGLLAMAALGISGYLSLQTLAGQAIAGCGADEGCGAVLASPWSKVLGVPVSLLGSATYLTVLVGLGLRLRGSSPNKLGDFLLLAAAPAMLIAAVWYTYIQLVEIQEICPYCMADHGIGVVLAILLPIIVLSKTTIKPAVPIVLGLVGCVALLGLQHATLSEDTLSTTNPFVDRDGDEVIDGERHVSLFSGELQFILEETPHIGDPRARQVVAVVFDYACPHCRATHTLIEDAIQAEPDAFVFVPLPISISPRYNPHVSSDNDRFAESYELATLAQAVAAVDMDKWRAFDHWLFSPESDAGYPRTAEDARAKAAELVGKAALDAQLTGEAVATHTAVIDRNIDLMALIPENARYIPVVTSPGAPHHLTERFYDISVLQQLLKEAAERLIEIEASTPADPEG